MIAFVLLATSFCVSLFEDGLSDRRNEHILKYVIASQESPELHTTRAAARAYVTGRDFSASNLHHEAISYYLKSVELDGTSSAPWVAMSYSLDEIARPDAALRAWGETLQRDPTNSRALFVIGINAALGGEYQKAVQLLSTLRVQEIESTPTDILLRDIALSSALEKIGDTTSSTLFHAYENDIINASFSELRHAKETVWLNIMQQLVDIGGAHAALQLAKIAAPKLDPQRQGAILSAMPVIEVAAQGNGQVTLATYSKIGKKGLVPLRPRWFEPRSLAYALSTAAQSMSSVGGIESSVTLYKASLALDRTDVVAMNNLAWSYLQRDGATEKAIALAFEAYALDPEAGFVQDTIGYANLLQGKSNEAIDYFVSALSDSAGDPQILDHLGDAFWKSHQRRDAISAWQKAYTILRSPEYFKMIIEGFQEMNYSVWGISIATPEALYDLEISSVVRRLQEKLMAVQEGEDPFEQKDNGAR